MSRLLALAVIGLLCCVFVTTVDASWCGKKGHWGNDGKCANLCGYCEELNSNKAVACDNKTGECPAGGKCKSGYTGSKCDQAICEPKCENGGKCIAPNMCFCGPDINLVTPYCRDIRQRGLIGSVIAILTVTLSIILCSIGSTVYKRNKAVSSA